MTFLYRLVASIGVLVLSLAVVVGHPVGDIPILSVVNFSLYQTICNMIG